MAENDSQMFISGTDPHSPDQLTGLRLRAYLLAHSLLSNQLVLGDTHFNNHPAFRSLIWPKEKCDQPLESRHRDLAVLLSSGIIVPAIRRGIGSLEDVRKDHAQREVKNVPSEEFVRFANEKLDGKRIDYSEPAVSQMFKDQALEAFSSPETRSKGKLTQDKQLRVYEFVAKQEKLLFNSVLKWVDQEIAAHRLTQRDKSFIDKILAACYRHNVPRSLDISLDFRFPDMPYHEALPLRFGTKQAFRKASRPDNIQTTEIRPAAFLSVEGFAMLPARVVAEIRRANSGKTPLASYLKVTKELEDYRRTGDLLSFSNFAGALERYFNDVDLICEQFLSGKERNKFLELQTKVRNKVTIKAVKDYSLKYIGIIFPRAKQVVDAVQIINTGAGKLKDLKGADAEMEKCRDDFLMGRLSNRPRLIHGITHS